jgi:hypothetical protein
MYIKFGNVDVHISFLNLKMEGVYSIPGFLNHSYLYLQAGQNE